MSKTLTFRIVTYNIHKCVGMDRRLLPDRVAEVLRETEADIVALQEVVRTQNSRRGGDQFKAIAEYAEYPHLCFGENRPHWGGSYGNGILSRWPIQHWHNHDVSIRGREPRGMLQADVLMKGSKVLHILNIHLGTSYMERRRQADRLLGDEALLSGNFTAPRILLGDFNEWTRGLATRRLRGNLRSAEPPTKARTDEASSGERGHVTRTMRSYPGVLPLLHLDHIYYDDPLRLREFHVHRTRLALMASDHLPLVACFEMQL